MQAAHLPHHLVAGAQVKVVGVGQLYLTADLLQIVGRHRTLDGPLGAHVHEHRRLHRAVGAGKDTPAGLSLCFQTSNTSKLLCQKLTFHNTKKD